MVYFLDGEAPDSRGGESGVTDVDTYGCWITRLGTTALMRFGTNWKWRVVDAPTKGQEDGWGLGVFMPDSEIGEDADWLISLPDKRLWSGSVVTTDPIYSFKDGYIIDGEGNRTGQTLFGRKRPKKGIGINLFDNTFTGCALAFTRPLLDAALPFPAGIPGHRRC